MSMERDPNNRRPPHECMYGGRKDPDLNLRGIRRGRRPRSPEPQPSRSRTIMLSINEERWERVLNSVDSGEVSISVLANAGDTVELTGGAEVEVGDGEIYLEVTNRQGDFGSFYDRVTEVEL